MLGRLFTRETGAMLWRNTVVSAGVFLLGLAVFWLLVEEAGSDPVIATGISFLIANSIHYVFGRSWIFAGSDRKAAAGYFLFFGNALVGLIVTIGLFWVFNRLMDLNYLLARAIVSIFAGLAVFVLNAGLNFKRL